MNKGVVIGILVVLVVSVLGYIFLFSGQQVMNSPIAVTEQTVQNSKQTLDTDLQMKEGGEQWYQEIIENPETSDIVEGYGHDFMVNVLREHYLENGDFEKVEWLNDQVERGARFDDGIKFYDEIDEEYGSIFFDRCNAAGLGCQPNGCEQLGGVCRRGRGIGLMKLWCICGGFSSYS